MKFGDKILIRHKLKRKEKRVQDENSINRYKTMKAWEKEDLGRVQEVIFLGYRTLSNGRRYNEDYGYSYRPTEYIRAALVCEGPNTNPYYVKL